MESYSNQFEVRTVTHTSTNPERNNHTARVYFMQSSNQTEKVAAMQLKYNINPLGAQQKPRSTNKESTVLKPSQFQDNTSLLTYYSLVMGRIGRSLR